mmetsp:Transcript_100215/g.176561  ORF Transcript_100215/g.176561 Transcript_100215/m.176561 type:complete len:346 (-) Transcript_100215:44-1081(-)
MAILAKYAYANTSEDFQAGLNTSFEERAGFHDVTKGHVSDFSHIPRMAVVSFTSTERWSGEKQKTIVISIKGTSNAGEAFADASLYSGVALLGFMSQVVDIFDDVPNTLVAFLLNHMRLPLVRDLEDKILDKAIKLVEDVKKKYENETGTRFVITGHSLGGGIAGAVGALTNTEAITFSAPGSHFNRFVFRSSDERQWQNMVNVWPENDMVPKVDRPDAFTQRINCKHPTTGRPLDGMTCHLITTTICELWRVCGDSRGRQMKLCTDKVDPVPAHYNQSTWRKFIRPNKGPIAPHAAPETPEKESGISVQAWIAWFFFGLFVCCFVLCFLYFNDKYPSCSRFCSF